MKYKQGLQMIDQHNLYIRTSKSSSYSRRHRILTLNLLKFISSNISYFRGMDVKIKIIKLSDTASKNTKIRKLLEKKKVTRLPALVTSSSTYIGCEDIKKMYQHNVNNWINYKRQAEIALDTPDRPPVSIDESPSDAQAADDENMLKEYYENEMVMEDDGDGNDDEHEEINGSGNMLSQYRKMMTTRDKTRPKSDPYDKSSKGETYRDDNVELEDDGFPTSDYDGQVEASGGSGNNDDLMAQAYWENQESSV